ncbi:unnamed protein product [Bursaphelenchus xylophilus]|uniref:(pine wood nematode) hypothetical protein n=1 Tax=Bursaphelenchus xylophilus TaxID=6326 RepID=A0A1I7SHL4_BURXY|nr:unnamed protein product [Bursaphelenchus xylophilus]CAG9104638.1 unnamed protein product [Bursaphelenchus xylophilus]
MGAHSIYSLFSLFQMGPAVYNSIEATAFCVAMIGNVTLFFLIIFKTDQEMEVYKIVLIYNCYSDVVLTVSSFFCKPFFVIYEGEMFMMAQKLFNTPSSLYDFILYDTFVFVFYQLFMVVPLSCYYRYEAVCRAHIIPPLNFFILAVLADLIPFLNFLTNWWSVYPDEEKLAVYKTMVANSTSKLFDGSKIAALSINSHVEAGLSITFGMTTILLSYITTATFLHKVIATFRVRNERSKWHDVNKQIAKVMVIQMCVPLAISTPALTLMWAMYVFQFEDDKYHYIVNILMTLTPLVNPFTGIFCIEAYRGYLSRLLCGKRTTAVATYSQSSAGSLHSSP